MFWQTEKGGSSVRAQLKKGVLGAGQVKKKGGGGSLPRYTPIGPTHIYMYIQMPPPPRRDTGVYFQYSYVLTPGVDIQGPL